MPLLTALDPSALLRFGYSPQEIRSSTPAALEEKKRKDEPKPYYRTSEDLERGYKLKAQEFDEDNFDEASSRAAVAVVPLWGIITQDKAKRLAAMVERLNAAEAIGTVVAPINSPGGSIEGTIEGAERIRAVRDKGQTKLVAVVDPLMASAATWLGTAMGEVVITPSGIAGSIGVISWYFDESGYLDQLGITSYIKRKPAMKARFSGLEEVDEDMDDAWQAMIDDGYAQFVAAMAKNRKVAAGVVEQDFGRGDVLLPKAALAAGLVDRIATIEQVLGSIGRPGRNSGRRRAWEESRMRAIEIEVGRQGLRD